MNTHDDDFTALDADFDQLRNQLAHVNAPHNVEQQLLRAFAKKHRSQGWWMPLVHWLAPGAAIAASVGMCTWMLLVSVTAPVATIPTLSITTKNTDVPFIALQSLEQIALEPNPRLIETQVPKLMFAGMGVAVSPEVAGESLRAEMLISASGQPLALRLSPQ